MPDQSPQDQDRSPNADHQDELPIEVYENEGSRSLPPIPDDEVDFLSWTGEIMRCACHETEYTRDLRWRDFRAIDSNLAAELSSKLSAAYERMNRAAYSLLLSAASEKVIRETGHPATHWLNQIINALNFEKSNHIQNSGTRGRLHLTDVLKILETSAVLSRIAAVQRQNAASLRRIAQWKRPLAAKELTRRANKALHLTRSWDQWKRYCVSHNVPMRRPKIRDGSREDRRRCEVDEHAFVAAIRKSLDNDEFDTKRTSRDRAKQEVHNRIVEEFGTEKTVERLIQNDFSAED